jgi:exopolysaccharide production protein ExoQ
MSFALASTVCAVGIAGLFYLNRNKGFRTSKALWLPVIWLWIIGSRPISSWLGMSPQTVADQQRLQLDGSPTDAFVFIVILAAGLTVLLWRRRQTYALLRVAIPIVIYFTYCLLSVLWSPFPVVALKRWTKDLGDLVMVLIVLTDPDPFAALQRLFSRVGFILMPASLLLIRYSDLGRGYDPDGNAMNTGVTTNKNTLGLVTFVLALGTLWSVRLLLRRGCHPNRGRRLIAQGTLLIFAVALLGMAQSATSIACFALGGVLILALGSRPISRHPGAVHAVVAMIALAAGLTMLFGGQASVVHTLGRQTDLTGRTDIWNAVIPLVPNAVIGAGFESFWIGPTVRELPRKLPHWYHAEGLNSSHNGYIETYLNLGWVGVGLIALILISGYRHSCAAFRSYSEIGSLTLAYVATTAVYNMTEAGFRMLTPTWMALLLALVAAGGAASGLVTRRASQLGTAS